MALMVGIHQRALHDVSNTAMSWAKYPWSYASDEVRNLTFREARTEEEKPVIPAPQIFHSLVDSMSSATAIPTVPECAIHLELLQTFRTLRMNVFQSTALDTTFGIVPQPRTVYRKPERWAREVKAYKIKDPTFVTRRRQKWPIFLGLAVARFRIWLEKADEALKLLPAESSSDAAARRSFPIMPALGAF